MHQLWITLNYIPGSWSSKIQCGAWKSLKIGRIFCTNLEKFNEAFVHHCRDNLAPASGFQSLQFRLIENKLGINKVWIENIPHVIIFKRQNQQHILFCKIVMAFVLFSLQSQRTRYNRQDYRSAGTKFDIWSSKYSIETTMKKDLEKPLTHFSEIHLFRLSLLPSWYFRFPPCSFPCGCRFVWKFCNDVAAFLIIFCNLRF